MEDFLFWKSSLHLNCQSLCFFALGQHKKPAAMRVFRCSLTARCTLQKTTERLSALYFASFHALSADVGLADASLLILDRNLLYVRAEHTVRNTVRVADTTTCHRSFTANFTNFRHRSSLQYVGCSSAQAVDDKKAFILYHKT